MPLKALWAKGCRGRPLPLRLWKIWDGGFWLRSLRECICLSKHRKTWVSAKVGAQGMQYLGWGSMHTWSPGGR